MAGVVGIVLAAGAAERMGEPKLLLPLGGTTILNATIRAVEASAVDRVVVVTGCDADRVEASIETDSVAIVRNPGYRRGNMSSFLSGTDTSREAEAYVLVAGDLPTVRTDAVTAVVGAWRSTGSWAVVAEYTDRIAHPFLLSTNAVTHARSMSGTKVLWRALVDSGDERVMRVALPFDAPSDVNTRSDYEALVEDR